MGEIRLDPDNLSYTVIFEKSTGDCKVCNLKGAPIETLDFGLSQVKVYEVKSEVQPSKFELQGDHFKSSPSHGYEELIVDREKHGDNFLKLNPEDISKLLSIVSNRITTLSKYEIGENIVVTRCLSGHGAFDLYVLPFPKFKGRGCSICKDNSNTLNREIFRDENFVIYTKFAPISNIDIVISPIRHLSFEALDDVLIFDLAGMIHKLLNVLNSKDLSLVIYESGDKHATINILSGCVSAYRFLQINEINEPPEGIASKLREKFTT
jgi:hypothetical protein